MPKDIATAKRLQVLIKKVDIPIAVVLSRQVIVCRWFN